MSNNCKCKCFPCSDHDMSYVSPPACRYLPSGVCHPSDVGRSKVRAMRSPPWQSRWFKDICYNSLEIASVLCCKSAGEQFFCWQIDHCQDQDSTDWLLRNMGQGHFVLRLDNNGLVRKLKRTRSKQMVAPCKYILLPEKDSNAFMLTQNSLFKPRH